MDQYFIITWKGDLVAGTNAAKRKDCISIFEDIMGSPFRFDKQDEYLCKKFKMEMVIKNERNFR